MKVGVWRLVYGGELGLSRQIGLRGVALDFGILTQ